MGDVCVGDAYSKLKEDVERKYRDNEDRKWVDDTAKAILVSIKIFEK